MFSLFKKKEVYEISGKNVLKTLELLQITEEDIHRYSKRNNLLEVKNKAIGREKIAKNLTNRFKELEKEINKKTDGKGVENKEHFEKIKNYLEKIEQILKQQLEELNQEGIIEDSLQRTIAICGNLKDKDGNDTDSKLTVQLKELSELLREQSKVVAKYIIEILNEEKKIKANNEKLVFYRDETVADALDVALKSVGEENVLTAPEILSTKIENKNSKLWGNSLIAYTEENLGIDKDGIYYEKGTKVLITVHGGGILTPQRIREAYKEGLLLYGNIKYSEEEFNNLLKGILPTGETIKLYKYEDIEKGVENLPHQYGIATPYDLIYKSECYKKEKFILNPLAICRAGGKKLLVNYHNLAKNSNEKLGCYHSYDENKLPQGSLLFISEYGNGLTNYKSMRDGDGAFVGKPKVHNYS